MTSVRALPLWCHLTALVLLPLTGVGALTATTVLSEVRQAASAEAAADAVSAFGRLTTLSSAVQQQIVPTLALAVVSTPAIAVQFGLTDVQGQLAQAQLMPLLDADRAGTSRALEAARRDPATRAVAEQLDGELARLNRTSAGAALRVTDLAGVYADYTAVVRRIDAAADAQTAAATGADVSGRTTTAIADVTLLGRLVQTAGDEIPQFVGTVMPGTGGAGTAGLEAALTARLAYQLAGDEVADRVTSPELSRGLAAVRAGAANQTIEGLAGAAGATGATPGMPQVLGLLTAGDQRNQAISALLDAAVTRAGAVATADRVAAERSRDRSLAGAFAVLALSLAAGVALGHRLSRSLRGLARAAAQISEGTLVDVTAAGPREVRTVSAALGAAVASLRRIQDQAGAVARGDLGNAALQEPLPGPLGAVVHASVEQIVHSVQRSEQLQFELAHQAAHDALTGLPNRAQALQLATGALHRGRRTGSAVGLLFIDLDGFKAVNDRLGHAAGDAVLQEVAGRLSAGLRSGDSVARLGGDEFVAVIEPVDGDEELLHLAHRLLAAVAEPISVPGPTGDRTQVTVGASIGAAVSADGEVDSATLLAQADAAAYQAKTHGRGRVEFFDQQLQARLTARDELERAVSAGLVAGEFFLVYQPVVDLPTGRLTGFEALVRWQRPGHGVVTPDEFIGVAEQSTLIRDLDRWVLGEATRQLARWRAGQGTADGAQALTVAVNLSGRHLSDPRVADDVTEALTAAALPPSALVLEVTETVLVSSPTALGQLDQLKGLGVGVAIDDFGTGYTSIGQLRSIPVDTVKIDRSFVAADDPASHSLVTLMIEAAHTFGLDVVAEGVETTGHLEQLRGQRCDRVQGFLLARPLSAEAAGDLLTEPVPAGR
ncbi:bifunctional diguanylate cyclase/phosphodiesterase [Modestobacter sp. NPDC049651]|uniref:putative bifunctional diguanylate cyclase/phosphodiesterase n=1 Tax=unclassified Modestobacter TaxID=2643866 RepID=UPI0033FD5908